MDQDPKMQGGDTENNPSPVTNNTNSEQVAPVSNSASSAASSSMPSETIIFSETVTSTSPTSAQSQPAAPTQMNQNQPVTSLANPPKKNHTGLIVAIIAVTIALLAGIGAAVWYFVIYSNPDKVAFDAIDGFLHEKSVSITGSVSSDFIHYGGSVTRNTLNFSRANGGDHSGLPNSSTITVGLEEYEEDEDTPYLQYSVEVGSVAMSDGVIYLRTNNLMDAVDAYLDYRGLSHTTLDGMGKIFYDLGEEFDNEWWQVSIPDIIEHLGLSDNSTAKSVETFYDCTLDIFKQDISGEIADLYSKHRFITVAKVNQAKYGDVKPTSGNSLYELSFDYEEMAQFINFLPNSDTANRAYACYNDLISAETLDDYSSFVPRRLSASDFKKVTAKDLEDSRDADTHNYYLEISNMGHQLKSFYTYTDSENQKVESHLFFSYDTATISAPESYRPITEFIDSASIAFIRFAAAMNGYDLEYDKKTDQWYLPDGTLVTPNLFWSELSGLGSLSGGHNYDDDYDYDFDDDVWYDDDFWYDDEDWMDDSTSNDSTGGEA